MNEDLHKLKTAFAAAGLPEMDVDAAVGLFAGNAALYLKVLRTYADNIGGHLDKLAGLCREEAIADYAIEVHGVKGSCYGIGATREGDMAKELELAAKAGDFAKVSGGNQALIEQIESFTDGLREVLQLLHQGGGKPKKPAPERAALERMLEASKAFDAERMQEAASELEACDYETGGDLVAWLVKQVAAFGYEEVRERLEQVL
ncbi:MAG: hypothetical protein LBR44_05735 [Clostridiales Family XIII bacterium]|jgi:HPt (histidine-containing phosphotransfer) domain-containing protein|nr:hypothetical protein [Clostridiales Family XIII bacterium]